MPEASCPRVLVTVIFSPPTNSRISSLITVPPPLMARGSQRGSRLHHWLPRPSLVPNFPRTGIEASTSCPMYLHPACNHKEGFGASLNCSISYQIVGGGQDGLSRGRGARRLRRATNSDRDGSYYCRYYRHMKGFGGRRL